MPPESTVGIKLPFEENSYNPNPEKWLSDKRSVDGVGDLWRIHDGLYDFRKFIKMHPGGQFWLKETQVRIYTFLKKSNIKLQIQILGNGYY